MLSPSTKIVMTGFFGVVLLLGVYALIAMYANSIMQDRAISRLLVGVRLSSLSETEKQKIADDVAAARAKTRYGLSIDFSKSDANLEKLGLTDSQCTARLIDFEHESSTCLDNSPYRPFEVIFSQCPRADLLAEEIKASCSIDLDWR